MDRATLQVTIHGVRELDMTDQLTLSLHTFVIIDKMSIMSISSMSISLTLILSRILTKMSISSMSLSLMINSSHKIILLI